MGNPDSKDANPVAGAQLEADAEGFLHDAATRRAVLAMGDGGSVEVLEALGALRLAAKQIHDSMDRFADRHGLSESRLRVLTRLYYSPDRQLPLGALAEGSSVTPRTMTDVVDVLERDGLVKRVPDPSDRRSILAVLTEEGLARVNLIRQEAMATQAVVAKGFTREQLVQLRHLCLLLVQNLNHAPKEI
jgi:DNA-binding MarR family transcriptional regulator